MCNCAERQEHSGGVFVSERSSFGGEREQVILQCGLKVPPGYFGATSTFK